MPACSLKLLEEVQCVSARDRQHFVRAESGPAQGQIRLPGNFERFEGGDDVMRGIKDSHGRFRLLKNSASALGYS